MTIRTNQNWISILHILMLVMIVSWTIVGPESVQGVFLLASQTNCSLYKFFGKPEINWWKMGGRNFWQESSDACQNGTLLCLETKAEWNFVKEIIKNSQMNSNNEWYIGLKKKGKNWEWLSGQPLSWTKAGEWPWQGGEPKNGKNDMYGKMWGTELLYDDVTGSNNIGYICEYRIDSSQCKNDVGKTTKASRVLYETTAGPQSVTEIEPKTTNAPKVTTSKQIKKISTSEHPPHTGITRNSQSTQSNPDASKQRTESTHAPSSKKTQPYGKASTKRRYQTEKVSAVQTGDTQQKGEFPITYLAIALAVLLLFLVCMLIVIYCWRNKKNASNKAEVSEEDRIQSPTTDVSEIIKSNSFVAFKMVHNNLANSKPTSGKQTNDSTPTGGTYESVCLKNEEMNLNSGSNATSEPEKQKMNEVSASQLSNDKKNAEVVYASVDKSAKTKKGNQEPQVTYADLASFNNNEETVVHMPPPYQPVQYAEIIGTKISKGK